GCRPRGKKPALGDIQQARICGRRGARILRPEHDRLVSSSRHVRRQNLERRKASGPSRRAADEVRVCDQLEGSEANRPHDSAERTGESGQSHQVKRGASEECRVERAGKNMKRKITVLALCAMLFALCFSAQAQQPKKIARIGILSPFSASDTVPWHRAFQQGLRERGWIEGQNIVIEYRYAEGKNNRLPDLAAELVHLEVDIIVTSGATETLPAKKVTTATPIVMAAAGDPVGTGLVDSLARPGGNVTGLTNNSPDLAGKRLELLKEVVPKLTRVALLWDPEGSQTS